MPVTAKLSKQLYDRLGEQVANELVEWFNQVDAAYRSDLRETNELNYARFSAEMARRFAEQELKFERRFAEMQVQIERGFREQTRFLYLALAAQIALIAGLYLR